jgi:tetratricopeptide (TPR) repeat protein
MRTTLTLLLDPDAVRLAKELDGLPLALATAGAYLERASITFSDYYRLYKASWAKLLKTSPELESYEDRTLYSTWQLSFDQVKERNELSANLLRMWAYFDNEDIWFELLRHGGLRRPDWIRELTRDELSFHEAMRVLSDHGLVDAYMSSQEQIESGGYSIHGCVHSWTIHVLNQKWDCDLAKLALRFVGSHVRDIDAGKWWLINRRLFKHATRCWDLVLSGLIPDEGVETVLYKLGILYRSLGKLDDAEKMYRTVLLWYEKVLDPDDEVTLIVIHSLANLYLDKSKLDDPEKTYHRALQGFEKAMGPDHTSTLTTINNLATLYAEQGKLDEAEKLYQRALQGREKVFGPDHISTLETVDKLGSLYISQNRLDQAEESLKRAPIGFEEALGPDHLLTLGTVSTLGDLYISQSRLDEAGKTYQRALQGREKVLGPDHTSTLDTVNNLGVLYISLGKLDEAEKLLQRALLGSEKAWGPNHLSTLGTVGNLGIVYKSQAKFDEAEKMYQRALRGFEKALGPVHASTLKAYDRLDLLHKLQANLEGSSNTVTTSADVEAEVGQ